MQSMGVNAQPVLAYDYLVADVSSVSDYYPGGMPMKERSWKPSLTTKYRFGFNGQHKDNEIAGTGNHNTAMFWEYDTRLGRRWNTDPVTKPWESRYATMGNTPIWHNDLLGNYDDGPHATNPNRDNHEGLLLADPHSIARTTDEAHGLRGITVTPKSSDAVKDRESMEKFKEDLSLKGLWNDFMHSKHDFLQTQLTGIALENQFDVAYATSFAGENMGSAISIYGYEEDNAIEREAGSIRNINKIGSKTNCVNCTIATDATLARNPASALDSRPKPLSSLESEFAGTFKHNLTSSDIVRMVNTHGQRGIVFGNRGPGQVGHVFNVVNQNGTVRFLDGQTGKAADLNGYKKFSLIRTN